MPGVWVYFLGSDFTMGLDLKIDKITEVDSTSDGFTQVTGAATAIVNLKMTETSD